MDDNDIITGPTNSYKIGRQVRRNSVFNMYLCVQEGTGRKCLFQIAADATQNGALDRATYILGELLRKAAELDEAYAKVKAETASPLNYQFGLPEPIESFICGEQDGRRVNILGFAGVEDVEVMVPLRNIPEKDRERVDLKTSVWPLGKVLKTLALAHSLGFENGRVNITEILIEHEKHYVVLFNWTRAVIHPDGVVPSSIRRREITQAARAIITILGGDYETRKFPDDGETGADAYLLHLLGLADGGQSDAHVAHDRFYELIDELWGKEYHPYTSIPL